MPECGGPTLASGKKRTSLRLSLSPPASPLNALKLHPIANGLESAHQHTSLNRWLSAETHTSPRPVPHPADVLCSRLVLIYLQYVLATMRSHAAD